MVEGTPLLREHTAYTRIEGSNPSVSASKFKEPLERSRGFCFCGFGLFSFLVNKIEGYTQEEIARKLQLTPSSVEKYMKRAMRHLQEKLQNYAPH